jgi:hypothetical protein
MRHLSLFASLRVVSCLIFAALLVIVAVGVTAGTAHAAPLSTGHLNDNNGRKLNNPEIHNLYMTRSWDSENPATMSSSAIDSFTRTLTTSGYFDPARPYGINTPSFSGSDGSDLICPTPILGGETEFTSVTAWTLCEAQPGPLPFVASTLTGIPAPDDNTLYVVYLSSGVQITDIAFKSCNDFTAYHFMGLIPAWHVYTVWGIPVGVALVPQRFAFAVVPAECAHNSFDQLTTNASHEIIEAATDPDIGLGWIDDSKLGFNADILRDGEAADLCEVSDPMTRLADGLEVAPYWSNADSQCEPANVVSGPHPHPSPTPTETPFPRRCIQPPCRSQP